MQLILADEEVEQYFSMIEENKELINRVGELMLKLTHCENEKYRLQDTIDQLRENHANSRED